MRTIQLTGNNFMLIIYDVNKIVVRAECKTWEGDVCERRGQQKNVARRRNSVWLFSGRSRILFTNRRVHMKMVQLQKKKEIDDASDFHAVVISMRRKEEWRENRSKSLAAVHWLASFWRKKEKKHFVNRTATILPFFLLYVRHICVNKSKEKQQKTHFAGHY